MPGALAQLRERGWRLAILSNTDPDLLAASVAAIGVPFDALITASEAGSYKPAPGHWERFFADTGAAPEHHVHVAASLFHDVEPAARMGLETVWINRLGESSSLPRAAELPDLGGLPEVLDQRPVGQSSSEDQPPVTASSTALRASFGSRTTRSPTPLRISRTSQSAEP